jgi:hypothetical protein
MMKVKRIIGAARPEITTPQRAEQRPRPLINFEFPRKVALFTPIKKPEYIERIARIVLDYEREQGEVFLGREMSVVSENLIATGADPTAVHREVRKLEASIRSKMWIIVMDPPL